MHGSFSVKSDVFSFGVLALEIVSGQKSNLFHVGDNTEVLTSYVSIKTYLLISHNVSEINLLNVDQMLAGLEELEGRNNIKHHRSLYNFWFKYRNRKVHPHWSTMCPRNRGYPANNGLGPADA